MLENIDVRGMINPEYLAAAKPIDLDATTITVSSNKQAKKPREIVITPTGGMIITNYVKALSGAPNDSQSSSKYWVMKTMK